MSMWRYENDTERDLAKIIMNVERLDKEVCAQGSQADALTETVASIKTRQFFFTIIQIASTWYMLDYFLGS